MTKDPFAPPDPFGDGDELDLSIETEHGYKLKPKRPEVEVPQAQAPAPALASAAGATKPTGAAASKACQDSLAKEKNPEPGERYHGLVAEEAMERKLLMWTPPVVFLLGFLFMHIGGDGFVRIFFGMWLHELGHATSAWVTGHWAVPGPWRTSIDAEQSISVTLVLLAILAFIGFRAWHSELERKKWTYVMGGLAFFVLVCTYGVSERSAQTAITFFGDGGMMIFGGALVLTFWAPVGTHLHTSWLRWGFIVIGSLAYLDGVFTWWPARKDASVIPYGEIEGVGLSDPTKLIDVAGWTQQELIDRHVYVIVIVGLILVARWGYGVWRIKLDMAREETG